MKVLLIRLSSLGDVVLATAAVEALRAGRPEAEVHVLTKPAFRDVFRNNPGVSRLVAWDPREGLGPLARRLRAERYDRVVDLHRNLRTWGLRLLVRGPGWDAYRKGALRRRAAVALRRPGLLDGTHVVERYVESLRRLGVGGPAPGPRVYPSARDRDRAEALLREAGWDGAAPLVGLAPGARWSTKGWPGERWAELVCRVRAGGTGFPVLVGGKPDRELCGRILGDGPGASLAGRTTVLETAAVLARCTVLVTNDSAPLHLAVAVGTRVVALFGPTVQGFGFYPLGPEDVVLEQALPCRPCSLHGDDRCPEGHHRCMTGIGVPEVVSALGPGPAARGETPGGERAE